MTGIICVGLGGGLGAALRYGISLLPYKGTFPALTLVTNVLGALVIGVIAGLARERTCPRTWCFFSRPGCAEVLLHFQRFPWKRIP